VTCWVTLPVWSKPTEVNVVGNKHQASQGASCQPAAPLNSNAGISCFGKSKSPIDRWLLLQPLHLHACVTMSALRCSNRRKRRNARWQGDDLCSSVWFFGTHRMVFCVALTEDVNGGCLMTRIQRSVPVDDADDIKSCSQAAHVHRQRIWAL